MDNNNTDRPRVLLGIGNPEHERRLITALAASGLAIAGRCLDGSSLLAQARDAEVVLAATGLHRLNRETVLAFRDLAVPLVLLVEPADVPGVQDLAYLLPAASSGPDVVAALKKAIARGPITGDHHREAGPADGASTEQTPGMGDVIAVVSGKGAPGATTVAIGLAAALQRDGRRVLLVDADLRGGGIGPCLDLDPRRGMVGLTVSGEPQALNDEIQEVAGVQVVAGIERPELRQRLQPASVSAALHQLAGGFDMTIVDGGETLAGTTCPASDAVLRLAGHVLLVTTPDILGLWNARACLRYLREITAIPPDEVGIVLNRRRGRDHYDATDVARALDAPVLATLPEDRRVVAAAGPVLIERVRRHRPMARELQRLASRLTANAQAAVETPAPRSMRRAWWRRPADAR